MGANIGRGIILMGANIGRGIIVMGANIGRGYNIGDYPYFKFEYYIIVIYTPKE